MTQKIAEHPAQPTAEPPKHPAPPAPVFRDWAAI